MKAILILIFLAPLVLFGQNQYKEMSKEDLNEQKAIALKSNDSTALAAIDYELNSRMFIEELELKYKNDLEVAISKEEFVEAGLINRLLQKIQEVKLLDDDIKRAVEDQQYSRAESLKKERDALKEEIYRGTYPSKFSEKVEEDEQPAKISILNRTNEVAETNVSKKTDDNIGLRSAFFISGELFGSPKYLPFQFGSTISLSYTSPLLLDIRLRMAGVRSVGFSEGLQIGLGLGYDINRLSLYGLVNGGGNMIVFNNGYGTKFGLEAQLHFGARYYFQLARSSFGVFGEGNIGLYNSNTGFSIGVAFPF